MNKPVIAAVALFLAAGLGVWLFAGKAEPPQAPLVPDAASPAATAPTAPGNPASPDADSPAGRAAAALKIAAGAAPTNDDGTTDGEPNLIGGEYGEPITNYELPEMFHIPRGLDRPEAKPGEAITTAAMKQADMGALDPSDGAYDEVVETHQLFNPLEKDFLSRSKVTADDWTDLLATHAPAKEAMLERSVKLAHDGHAEESESMLLEWSALEMGYGEKVEN